MELRKRAKNALQDRKSASPTPYVSPPPARRGSKATLTSAYLQTEAAAPEPQLRRQAGGSSDDPSLSIGLITSETAGFILVRTKNAWVPIKRGRLIGVDSVPIPASTPFAQLKMKRARILQPGCSTSCAQMLDSIVSDQTQENERPATPLKPESGNLLNYYEQLAVRLMTDVVALSRLVETSCQVGSAQEFLSLERQKLEKKVKVVVSELEMLKTPGALQMKQVLLNLLHNLSDRAAVTCENCHVAKYDVRLSCGHKYCNTCQHKLVQVILSGNAQAKCFLCRTELSKVDEKLVALEQYHNRPKKDASGAETARCKTNIHLRRASHEPEAAYRCYVCHCCVRASSSVSFRCPNCESVSTARAGVRPREKAC